VDESGDANGDASADPRHADTLSEPVEVHHRPSWAPLTIAAFLALVVCTNIANVVWADWVDDHPARLLALSSRLRYLVFTAAGDEDSDGIDALPYGVIGGLRIAAAFIVCHLAGRAYRDDLLRIFTRYLGLTPEALDAYHRVLDKAEIVIIPWFAGSNIIAALTGVRKTPPARLVTLLAIGIAARLALFWWLATGPFEDEVKRLLKWVDRYTVPIIIGSIALVILVNVRNFRRGAGA
jgi:hypothetical protein